MVVVCINKVEKLPKNGKGNEILVYYTVCVSGTILCKQTFNAMSAVSIKETFSPVSSEKASRRLEENLTTLLINTRHLLVSLPFTIWAWLLAIKITSVHTAPPRISVEIRVVITNFMTTGKHVWPSSRYPCRMLEIKTWPLSLLHQQGNPLKHLSRWLVLCCQSKIYENLQ